MKVLYITPHPNPNYKMFNRFTHPPLTLKQLAGITPAEHDVMVIDERIKPIPFNSEYDAVGLSCMTFNVLRGYEVAEEFRKRGIPVFMGGYHPSLLPDEVKPHVDSVVIGEAELTLPRLLSDIEHNQLKPFYRPERFVEPEEIPPARHDIGTYNPFDEPIQATRGCPTGCDFCAMTVVEGNRVRARPVDHMIDEMKSIKTKSIFFADASLTVKPSYSKSLFKAMAELNKYFSCYGNINVLARDDEFLRLAREAGIFNWYVGIESISQENIDASGKSTNKVEQYKQAVKKIRDNGMMITGFFMFGFDFDTVETFDKTLQAMYDWGFDEVSFSVVTPYPGTGLFNRYEKEGRITCRDWSKYAEGNVNYTLKNLTEKELREGIKRISREFYSYPNIIKRSFSNSQFSLYRIFIKLIRSYNIRQFYIKEKLR